MPRQVDHEERRRRIAEAVCTLIARSGMEAVSLRDVAAQAEVSMGAVQRSFRTKEDMLLFALEHLTQYVSERAEQRIAATSTPQAAATLLSHTLAELALLEEESRRQAHVWLAFVAHAPASERLAAVLKDTYAKLHDLLVRLLRYGQDTGEVAADLDAAREAHALLALADGLTAHVVAGHHSSATALAVLQRQVDQVLVEPPGNG
ncbi:TetR family transcriptional regulator C-terminal domain-containing protein [Streptomyces oryzae]|uniref:TetR family transcriptional regulator C-terminal domain-containing protein n=1 Tax=Streptomyces oryzae TaxID=1434886 RepID=A0ABS3XCA1_9ACTN|nr:TetR family transcriptional regulator C-terminal domain-containing protein [Streptomyces oryzae]MBO8192989.1 TetR family transcriptional regulator C-terminal domain-containing protein [Streptomyces oryzae]